MEKITLKPVAKELLFKNGEAKTHFDVLSYQGLTNQERNLGSLFIVGQVKFGEEDLSYVLSLVSSLARREYYSEASLTDQNPKGAFERSLKKLNEVLEDFFKNKDLQLNMGLFAVAGDNIYISRLGKFKIALARDDKYIDILNNIELFNKDTEGETQFANIISGRLQPKDKIFAYFPARPITLREKQLNPLFVKENQEGFSDKIAHLAANANAFACCGVHLVMDQIKEIPISSAPTYAIAVNHTQAGSESPAQDVKSDENIKVKLAQAPATETPVEKPRIITAELSVVRRANILTPIKAQFGKLSSLGRLPRRTRSKIFLVIALIVIAPLLLVVILRGGSSQAKNAYNRAILNYRLAQSKISQNDTTGARSALSVAGRQLAGFHNKQIDTLARDINRALDALDHASDKLPSTFADLGPMPSGIQARFIAGGNDSAVVMTSEGKLWLVNAGGHSELAQVRNLPTVLLDSSSGVAFFNGKDTFGIYDSTSKKIKNYGLGDPSNYTDGYLYEGNLYVVSGDGIYKYSDAAVGGSKKSKDGRLARSNWGKETLNGMPIALAVDGNVYVLNAEGKLTVYFKGKKTNEYSLQLSISPASRLFTAKDSAFFFLADKIAKRVYVLDKTNGNLRVSYKLGGTGDLADISVAPDGTIWALSTGKIWRIKP